MKFYKLKKLLFTEKGEGIISALYTMLVLTVVLFMGIDIFGYTSTAWKLRNTCSETLTLMKMENGFDFNIERSFFRFAELQGLNTKLIKVNGTDKTVQRGDVVTIQASMPYKIRSIKPFNRQLNVDINIEMSGLAQEFVRD